MSLWQQWVPIYQPKTQRVQGNTGLMVEQSV